MNIESLPQLTDEERDAIELGYVTIPACEQPKFVRAPDHYVIDGALSRREWQIMLAIAKGESPSDTAKRLHLSVKTISTYRARIIEKTGLTSNAAIAVQAFKQGLIK